MIGMVSPWTILGWALIVFFALIFIAELFLFVSGRDRRDDRWLDEPMSSKKRGAP